MAVAPPLVYADQAYSIVKKRQAPAAIHSVVSSVDTNRAQGLNWVLSGRLRNPVRPKRFRINPPSPLIHITQFTLSFTIFAAPSEMKPHCQHYKMFLLVGGSVRNASAPAVDIYDLGPGRQYAPSHRFAEAKPWSC